MVAIQASQEFFSKGAGWQLDFRLAQEDPPEPSYVVSASAVREVHFLADFHIGPEIDMAYFTSIKEL